VKHFECDLQPKQERLYLLLKTDYPDSPTWLGYGGSRGGAKSGAIRRCALALASEQPKITVWIFRRVYEDLRKDHIEKFWEDFPELQQYYKAANHEITLPNLSKIGFVYAETKDEVIRKFRGPEAKYIFVDQAEQLSEEELNRLHSANRAPGTRPGQCKIVLCFNPGGIGTEFLRRVFFLKQYKPNEERPSDYEFIQAYGWDNYEWFRGLGIDYVDFYKLSPEQRFDMFIKDTDYGRNLNSLPAALRVGELLGSFEHFAGQYFAGVWDEQKCVLSSSLTRQMIQPWWSCWMSQDWAFAEHAVHLWFCAGKLSPSDAMKFLQITTEWPIDVVIVYRCLVVQEMAEADLAMKIVDMTPDDEQPERFWLSPDAWAKRGAANTVAQQFEPILLRHGLPQPEQADDDRIGGWRHLYNGFRQSSSLRGSVADEERARQGPLLFISAECPEVISHIPLAVRDEDNLEDVARVSGVLWEDITDALRYGYKSHLESRGLAPRAIRRQMVYDSLQDMTAKALAVRKFDADERSKSLVSRGQRWR